VIGVILLQALSTSPLPLISKTLKRHWKVKMNHLTQTPTGWHSYCVKLPLGSTRVYSHPLINPMEDIEEPQQVNTENRRLFPRIRHKPTGIQSSGQRLP